MNLGKDEITRIFRSLYLAEIEAGTSQNLEHYQALFPGHEELIAGLFARMDLGEEATGEPTQEMIFKIAEAGDLVSHYRLEREIGRGGQAVVFAATDEKLNRRVAVKILTRLDLGSESTLRRFQREAELCSKLNHTSICTVYESGIHDGMPFIAMELIDGGTIANRIETSRTMQSTDGEQSEEIFFPSITDAETDDGAVSTAVSATGNTEAVTLPGKPEIREILKIFREASDALHEAHQAGIVHRDIKPGNIMVRSNGTPVILDFGLAHDTDSDRVEITQTGDFFGTPAYMSPEQLSAHRIRLDHRTDIFSLGVSLYEAVTLKRPFDSSSREEIYQSILTKEAVDPRKLNPAVSRDVAVVIGKAMEKDRDRRYASADDFAQDLDRILELKPIQARPASLALKMTRWMQRNRALALFILILPLVGLISVMVTDKVQESRQEKETATLRQERWEKLKEKFDELVELQDNAALSMILQARSRRSIGQDVEYLGEEAKQWMRDNMDDKAAKVRLAAIGVITEIGDKDAADLLVEHCLHDESEAVQLWCSQALFRIPDDSLIPHLFRVFEEAEHPGSKVNAIFGLAALKVPEAAKLCRDMYFDNKTPAAMKYALALNVLMLGRPGLEPVADSFASTLRPDDLQGWGSVLEYYRNVATPAGRKKLEEFSENQVLPEMIRKQAAKYLEKRIAESEGSNPAGADKKQKTDNE